MTLGIYLLVEGALVCLLVQKLWHRLQRTGRLSSYQRGLLIRSSVLDTSPTARLAYQAGRPQPASEPSLPGAPAAAHDAGAPLSLSEAA